MMLRRVVIHESSRRPHQFVRYGGVRILLVDHTGLSPEEHIRNLDVVKEFITGQPLRSLLLLTLANTNLTDESADAIRRYVHAIDGFVHANAVVCHPGSRVAFNIALNRYLKQEISCFEHAPDALAWLLSRGDAP